MKVLGINGSLRQNAYSKAVLETIIEKSAGKATIEHFPLHDIPLYNEDIDTDENRPESVTRFKQAITESAGLIIVTPEYNYAMSGVLKNALDWASRPAYKSCLVDKPVLLIGSSIAGTGAVRALIQAREFFLAVLARPVPVPDIALMSVQNKVDNGRVTDETTLQYLARGVDSLIEEIRMLNLRKTPTP